MTAIGTGSSSSADRPLVVTSRPRPFGLARTIDEVPHGLTLAQIVEIVQPDQRWYPSLAVRIGDDPEPIDRRLWHRVRPRPGQRISVVILPQGATGMRTALMLAVVVVALIAAPYLAPAFMGAAGVSAVGAALSIGGMLAINALVPVPSPKEPPASSPASYSLSGGTNRARLWEAIPRVLGRHRMAPDLAAPWVTDVDGDKVYLCGLLSFGYGPLAISDVRIGDTAIGGFDEVQIHTSTGAPGEVFTSALYPNTIIPLAVSQRLSKATGWVSRTASADVDLIVVELALPNGGYRAGSDPGERVGISVNFEIDLQPIGGTRYRWGTHRIDAKTTTTKRSTIRIVPPSRQQCTVHIRRITDDADEDDEKQRIDESWWIAIRSHRNEIPVRKSGLCLMAIRVKATEQFSGTIDNLTAIAHSIGWEWNPTSNRWDTVPTNKPHALFRIILQGGGQKNPVDDDKLDFATLEAWGAYCWEKGLTCNVVLDQGVSTWDALRTICAAGRAAPTCATGTWSVVVDWERPYPLQQFTPRNSTGFKGRRLFVDLPHALRCRFIDETSEFEERELVVYDDGRDVGNSSRFESVEFPGVTDPDQVYKLARMRIAEARLRAETFELETSFEWLTSTRGDRVSVASDVTEWGADSFRIKELIYTGNNLSAIRLDGTAVFDGSYSYDIAIRGTDEQFVYPINVSTGSTDTVALRTAIVLPPGLQEGDLLTIGERGIATYDCLIQAITPGKDLSARLNLIPYNEGVYRADTEVIPPWTSGSTRQAGTERPVILSVRSGESAGKRNADGSLFVRVVIALYDDGSRPLTMISGVEVRWREKDTGSTWLYQSHPADAREVAILEAEDNTTVELAVRYLRRDGRNAPWTATLDHFVDGPDVPPPDVPALYVDGDRLSWTAPNPLPPDLDGYRLFWNTTENQPFNSALLFSEGLQTDTWIPLGAVPDSAAEMMVVAVTTAGLQSVNPARAKITPGMLPDNIEISRTDYRAQSFAGSKVNCEVSVEGDLVATDTSRFLLPTSARFLDPASGSFLAANWAAMTYEVTFAIPSMAREGDRVRLDMEYEGAIQLFYAWGGDSFETWPPENPITDEMWSYANQNASLPFGVLVGSVVSLPGVFDLDVFEDDVFETETAGIAVSTRGLRPWRTAIGVRPQEALRVQLRSAGGSGVRPRVTKFQLVLEGPEIEQQFANFVVSAAGSRLPVSERFRKVEWIYGIPRADGSSEGMSPGYVTKELPTGPIVIVRDQLGRPIDAMSDWRIGGV